MGHSLMPRSLMACSSLSRSPPARAQSVTAGALLVLVSLVLVGCDINTLLADPKVAQREADGKATGGACRYALRGIEDCYLLNEKASRTAIFNGWKEMDVYMRENKIEGVPTRVEKARAKGDDNDEIITEKPAKMAAGDKGKSDAKPAQGAGKALGKVAASATVPTPTNANTQANAKSGDKVASKP